MHYSRLSINRVAFIREKGQEQKINPSILTKNTQYIPIFMQVAHSPVSVL